MVWCGLFLGQVVVFRLDTRPNPVLLIRVNLCNLWMIILKDWIPGQATPPNRYALRRGPRQAGMTRLCSLWMVVPELGGYLKP